MLGFAVCHIQGIRRGLHPGRGVLLQVVDLQIGNCGIAGIHFSPLLQHRLCEFRDPGVFVFRYGIERGALLIGSRRLLTVLQLLGELVHAIVHAFHFATVTAQEVVAEVKPVLHDLETNMVGGLRHFQRLGGGGLGALFAMYGEHNHCE